MLLLNSMLKQDTHEGTLKWKSQEITNAKTIQASKKLRKRWPCQKFRVSVGATGAAAVAVSAAAAFVSFHCSINSASFTPTTFLAIDPHISQVLQFRIFKERRL